MKRIKELGIDPSDADNSLKIRFLPATTGSWRKRSKPPFRAAKTHAAKHQCVEVLASNARIASIDRNHAGGDRGLRSAPFAIRKKSSYEVRGCASREVEAVICPSGVSGSHSGLQCCHKQKRLTANPCEMVEFPVSVSKSTRKPHYMTASEQQKIEFVAPPR